MVQGGSELAAHEVTPIVYLSDKDSTAVRAGLAKRARRYLPALSHLSQKDKQRSNGNTATAAAAESTEVPPLL